MHKSNTSILSIGSYKKDGEKAGKTGIYELRRNLNMNKKSIL